MSILGDWQAAVKAQLTTALQSGSFTVLDGRRDGDSKNRKLACVFGDGMPAAANPYFCRPTLVVRAWLPKPKQPQAAVPKDTTPLEQLLQDVLAALKPVQVVSTVDGGRGVYAQETVARMDVDDWGVEVTLVGWTSNPSVAG